MDDPREPGSEPPAAGGESSLGGAGEWSTVPPSSYTPPSPPAAAQPPANTFGQPTPAPSGSLEPLPPTSTYGTGSAGGPVAPLPQPYAPPAGQQGYQQVYGTPSGPEAYASAPGGGYPPPPQPPPPGYTGAGGPPPGYPPGPPPPAAGQGLSSNAAAAISYITFIPAVLFLVMEPYNRDRFVRFHAWQCIALTVVWVVVSILFAMFSIIGIHLIVFGLWTMIHMLIRLVLFIFWLIALIKASQGQWFKIPIVGDLAQSFAGKAQ